MTETDDFEVDEYITPIINTVVRRAAHKWRRYLQPDELRSMAWLWVHEHPDTIKKHAPDGTRGERRLSTIVSRVLERAGRVEKAAAAGYDPDDEEFYSLATIELVLPALFDDQYKPWDDSDVVGRAGPSDPATGFTWETMVVDVRKATESAALTAQDWSLLSLRYRDHELLPVIGRILEVGTTTVSNRLRSILYTLREELGGARPGCPPGCECGAA